MRHIVDKVILDFRISLLAENDEYRENERYQQHDGENYRRYHEANRRIDITINIGEMYLNYTHLRLWIVAEYHLRIGIFLTFFRILRTTIYFTTILC